MNLGKLNVKELVEKIAGPDPAPGGGSAAALAGALGAALCAMVARLTLGKEKHGEVWQEMEATRDSADALCSRLLELMDQDSEAYKQVLAAFRLRREDKAARKEAIQAAMKQAASVPFETLRAVAGMVGLVQAGIDKGNPNCLTDAGVAAQLLHAAAVGAGYNVRINLQGIQDPAFRSQLGSETSELLNRIEAAIRKLEKTVESRLK
jgi:formiminotetrahydrofolate cyclodeaminase